MFGISPLGWVHTLSSIPAIPAAAYMLIRHGRIMPQSKAGVIYFVTMMLGAVTVFPVAHMPVSRVIAVVTIFLLLVGYGIGKISRFGRATRYIEVISLTLTVFLLMAPTVSETLRRVPDGHPFVTDLNSPLFKGAQAGLLIALIIGLATQIIFLRKQPRTTVQSGNQ